MAGQKKSKPDITGIGRAWTSLHSKAVLGFVSERDAQNVKPWAAYIHR